MGEQPAILTAAVSAVAAVAAGLIAAATGDAVAVTVTALALAVACGAFLRFRVLHQRAVPYRAATPTPPTTQHAPPTRPDPTSPTTAEDKDVTAVETGAATQNSWALPQRPPALTDAIPQPEDVPDQARVPQPAQATMSPSPEPPQRPRVELLDHDDTRHLPALQPRAAIAVPKPSAKVVVAALVATLGAIIASRFRR